MNFIYFIISLFKSDNTKFDANLENLASLTNHSSNINFKIEYANIGEKGEMIKNDFTFSVYDYIDEYELGVFKVICKNEECKIKNNYFTGFCISIQNLIILQRIFYDSNKKCTSELITYDPIIGDVVILGEIGNFELSVYYPNDKLIIGYNHNDEIQINI